MSDASSSDRWSSSNGEGNKDGSIFALKDTVFHEFVNFLDCTFDGPVEIRGCRFEKGTNLLGNRGQPYAAQFRAPLSSMETKGAWTLMATVQAPKASDTSANNTKRTPDPPHPAG